MLCLFKPLFQSSRSSLMCTNPSAHTETPCCFITASVKLARSLNGAGRISAFELCSPLMWVLTAPFLDFLDGTGSLDLILTVPLSIEAVHWIAAVPSSRNSATQRTYEENSGRSDECKVNETVVRWWRKQSYYAKEWWKCSGVVECVDNRVWCEYAAQTVRSWPGDEDQRWRLIHGMTYGHGGIHMKHMKL